MKIIPLDVLTGELKGWVFWNNEVVISIDMWKSNTRNGKIFKWNKMIGSRWDIWNCDYTE
jgi:hypothetical protein